MFKVTSELKVGDVIEIVRHDGECKMNLRRVRISSILTDSKYHHVIACNLQGQNSWDYRLPLKSWGTIVEKANNIGWYPFEADAEFDG